MNPNGTSFSFLRTITADSQGNLTFDDNSFANGHVGFYRITLP